jgi:hypothetical protein
MEISDPYGLTAQLPLEVFQEDCLEEHSGD